MQEKPAGHDLYEATLGRITTIGSVREGYEIGRGAGWANYVAKETF
jgi:hypothetical protein